MQKGRTARTHAERSSERSLAAPPSQRCHQSDIRTPATSAIDVSTAVPGAQPRRTAVGGSTIMRRVLLILAMVAGGMVVAACGSDQSPATLTAAQISTLQKEEDAYHIEQIAGRRK